jgi:hypothetical protein
MESLTRAFRAYATAVTQNKEDQNGRDEQCKKECYSGQVEIDGINFPRESGSAVGYKWNPGLHQLAAPPVFNLN